MVAICSYETSVDSQWTTLRYIPEDGTLHNHRCENLKFYILRDVHQTLKMNLKFYSFLSVGWFVGWLVTLGRCQYVRVDYIA
jgi:hypothetical protein